MHNLTWKSPYEVLHGKAPDYATLRTMGCLCFAASVGERDKFAPRAHQCIFLGYTFGFKGYKLYDLQTKRIFHSRNVLFKENIFPFKLGSTHLRDSLNEDVTGPIFPQLAPPALPTSPQSTSFPYPSSFDISHTA